MTARTKWIAALAALVIAAVAYTAGVLTPGLRTPGNASAEAGAEAGAEVLIGEPDDAVVFDWEPASQLASGSNPRQHHGPRGTDPRL